jgi:hypothetical protein
MWLTYSTELGINTGMDIYTPVKTHLEKCKHSDIQRLADESGIPFTTIIKIKYGETKNPGVLTIQPLFNVIMKQAAA